MVEYQIEDVFTTNPTLNGWVQFGGASLNWDGLEKVGGILGADDNCRYNKYLGKTLNNTDNILASFTFMVDDITTLSGEAIIGFFDVNRAHGKEHCFGMVLRTSSGVAHPHVYIAYSDGTKVEGTASYTLNNGDKYVAAIRYVPEDSKAYLEIYDFLTQTLLFQEDVSTISTKSLSLNQIGISEVILKTIPDGEAWIYDMNAVGEPEPVVYSSLYCTPEEARKMTNLDAVQDMTDEMVAQIERVYAMPQIDARFRSEGYQAPFQSGTNTPPLVRTIAALLTAAYACKKSYIGHAPSDSPTYETLLEEVNKLWDDILKGKLELISASGNWIERTLATSTDMLSTTEGIKAPFNADDLYSNGWV
jgi:hypothetical protein